MKYKILILFFCFISFSGMAMPHKMKMRSGNTVSKSVFIVAPQNADYSYVSTQSGLVTVYPNPTSDKLYLKGDEQSKYTIELINMLGAVVLHEEISNGMVSLSDLPSGIYMLKLSGADGQLYLSSKLIKQ